MKNPISIPDPKNYAQARKQVAICNLSSLAKITVYGPSATDLINSFSMRDVTKINEISFFTILLKKKKYIDEVQIIKLSPIKYLVITNNYKKVAGCFAKYKRKFPLVTIEDSTNAFSLFSFHGDKAHEYFADNDSSTLYKITHQQYTYYTVLTSNINKFAILDHFKSLGFFEISLETRNIFMYNNNVLRNLEKVKRSYRLNTYISLYLCDNCQFKVKRKMTKNKIVLVKQFESTKNIVVTFGIKIRNNKRRSIGYVHNFYRLPNKKNPYLLGVVKKNKVDRMALLTQDKNEIIIKEFLTY